jgi:integrase/recombinase XerD
MPNELTIPSPAGTLATSSVFTLPATIADHGDKASERFFTFFTDQIPNKNTRAAYYRNALRFFAWCEKKGLTLSTIKSYRVSAYLTELAADHSTPTVKQHLASLRMLFDWLILGQIIETNPAHAVRAAKHVVKKGKTPVLKADEARQLLDSIDTATLIGLRDRALIAVMVYSFARIGATLAMKVEDYYTEGRRAWFRLHEKGGKRHEVPANRNAEAYVYAYIEAAGFANDRKGWLFRSIDRERVMTARPMHRNDALRMIKLRAKAAGMPTTIGCHTFRATGITVFRKNGGSIEAAQHMANHASPKTTMLYDRSRDEKTVDEVERIVI